MTILIFKIYVTSYALFVMFLILFNQLIKLHKHIMTANHGLYLQGD